MSKKERTNALVNKFMVALGNRNLEEITILFADKVDWDIPGNKLLVPWIGKRSNNSEVKAFYKLLWQHTEPLSAQIDQNASNG
jgi:hypothetical protein